MTRDDIIATIRAHERELRRLGVVRLSLFGSAMRDELTPDSDIDVLVTFDTETPSLRQFRGAKHVIEDALGRKIDYGRHETLKTRIRDRVLAEAIDVIAPADAA